MTNISNFTALSGMNFSADFGHKIKQEDVGGSTHTVVYDNNNNLVYEENDTNVSDSSTMYFYDDSGKLASSTQTWYEVGVGKGRNEGHAENIEVKTTMYDKNEKPIKGVQQMYYRGQQIVADVNYDYEENGDYTEHFDKNRDGKIDDGELLYHYDKNGEYITSEEFAEKHPPKEDPQVDDSSQKETFWEKAKNWFKNLFS